MGAVKSKVAKKLHWAIRTNSYDRAKEIISKCPDVVNYPIHSGKTTPMWRVAYLWRLEMANLFLDWGADIDLPCKKNGNTPLMWAAWRNNVDMLNFLLEKGANVHILNHEGENVMDIWYDA